MGCLTRLQTSTLNLGRIKRGKGEEHNNENSDAWMGISAV